MIDCVDCAWSIPNWCYFKILIPHPVYVMLSKYVAHSQKLRFYCSARKNLFFSLYFVLIQWQWFYAKFHFSYSVPGHCTFFLSITIYVIFQIVLHSLFVFFVFIVVVIVITGVVVVSETIILCIFCCSKGRVNSNKRMSLSSGKVANVRVLFIFTKQFAMTMQPFHCVLCAYCNTNDVWITWA